MNDTAPGRGLGVTRSSRSEAKLEAMVERTLDRRGRTHKEGRG